MFFLPRWQFLRDIYVCKHIVVGNLRFRDPLAASILAADGTRSSVASAHYVHRSTHCFREMIPRNAAFEDATLFVRLCLVIRDRRNDRSNRDRLAVAGGRGELISLARQRKADAVNLTHSDERQVPL
jgi:hypothetical protein